METNYWKAMLEQAEMFEKDKQLDLAQHLYNAALQLIPEAERSLRALILLRRGAIAYRLHNSQGALDDFTAAMKAAPELARRFDGDFSKYYEESCHSK